MIVSILRSAGSIIVSLVIALVLLMLVEGASAIFHPFPPGVDTSDLEVCKAHVAKYPRWVLALAVPAWGLTTLIATWLATRVGTARHAAHGFTVGVTLLLAAGFNMYLLPYPIWFEGATLVVLPLGIYSGVTLARTKARHIDHEQN